MLKLRKTDYWKVALNKYKDGKLRPRKSLRKPDNFMFFVVFSNISWGSSEAILKALFHESKSIKFKLFFININSDFRFLAQKCLKPCVNDVLRCQLFFLNRSSKWCQSKNVKISLHGHLCQALDRCNSTNRHIHLFSKIAITVEPMMKFWCFLGLRISYTFVT